MRVIANLKMYGTKTQVAEIARYYHDCARSYPRLRFHLAASYVYLHLVEKGCAAQNVSPYAQGAYTGQVSAAMLSDMGVSLCLLQHAETGETSADTLYAQVQQLMAYGIHAVICCQGHDANTLGQSLEKTQKLHHLGVTSEHISIAYEPVHAIGSGQALDPQHLLEAVKVIRAQLQQYLGFCPELLYGGSVHEGNVFDIISKSGVQGVLVGGLSREPERFSQLIDIVGKLS